MIYGLDWEEVSEWLESLAEEVLWFEFDIWDYVPLKLSLVYDIILGASSTFIYAYITGADNG